MPVTLTPTFKAEYEHESGKIWPKVLDNKEDRHFLAIFLFMLLLVCGEGLQNDFPRTTSKEMLGVCCIAMLQRSLGLQQCL